MNADSDSPNYAVLTDGPVRAADEAPQASSLPSPSKPRIVFVVLLLATVVCLCGSLFVGRGTGATLDSIFLSMRAQRAAVGFFCGASLAVAGAVIQGLFRNPLANPHMLGVSSAATLGAHVALLACVLSFGRNTVLGMAPEMMVPLGALLGATLSLLTLLSIVSLRVGPLALLLTGYALTALFQGMSAFLTNRYQEAWELNRALQALSLGNISAAGPRQVALIAIMTLGGAIPAMLSSSTLDVLLAGEEEATALGVDVRKVRFWLVLWVAIMTAGTVAVGGSVGFVGLIVPHTMRHLVGQRHKLLLPASWLAGGLFLVVCDAACRLTPARLELPLGVLTDLIGAPIFMRMLLRMARAELRHG